MKRKLVTVLMTAIIGSSMLFAQTAMAADTTAQTEDTAKQTRLPKLRQKN